MSGDAESPLDEEVYEAASGNNSKVDPSLISAVVKEVMKAFSKNHGAGRSQGSTTRGSNFAGAVIASNVANYNDILNSDSWIIDSGASFNKICVLRKLDRAMEVGLPDGSVKRVN